MSSPRPITPSSFPRSSVGMQPATLQRRVAGAVLLLSTVLLSTAPMAADRLTGKAISQLLTDTHVWAKKEGVSIGSSSIAMEQHGSMSVQYSFSGDGSMSRTSGGRKGGFTAKGTWWVKKGKLCTHLEDDKKRCNKLEPLGDGKYRLYGKGGKPRNVVFERITSQ